MVSRWTSVCLSVSHPSVHPSVFGFRMITWVNINGFSPNLVCALILWRSGLGLLMGKFHQILTELSVRNMIMVGYYSLTFLQIWGKWKFSCFFCFLFFLKNTEQMTKSFVIALDKELFLNQKLSIFFLFLDENICCGYSSEAPRWDTSNEYPRVFVEK